MKEAGQQLAPKRLELVRKNARGFELGYGDTSVDGIDGNDSARDFLQAIEDFTTRKAHEAAAIRKRLGVPDGLQKNQARQGLPKGQSKCSHELAW